MLGSLSHIQEITLYYMQF